MEGTLRRFNYLNETERKMAFEYRQHEVRVTGKVVIDHLLMMMQVPFMLLNVPEMERVVRKWTVCDVV